MIRRSTLAGLGLAVLAALARTPAASAEPRILPDSTVLDVWQLQNGLRVVVRHISNARHVAVTFAWPTGSDSDPKGLGGRAALLAELELTAAAGLSPERSRAEMNTIRPSGWGAGVSPRVTQLTEVATLAQFPGVLHQMAERLQGVTVTDSTFRHALATMNADLRAQRSPTSTVELYSATRAVSRGAYDPADAEVGLRGLAKLKVTEVQQLIRQNFVPAGAVLSLAGNLGDMNLPALIENEYGKIPGGTRPPEAKAHTLASGSRDLGRAGLKDPAGALAILAPALEDTLHPSFYVSMLFLGGFCQKSWGPASPPLTSRFQYSLFDDPELVRFYPPPGHGTAADTALDLQFNLMVSRMGAMVFPAESYEGLLRGVGWLLGGPLPPEMLDRAEHDPNLIATVGTNQAVRELWGGEPFWSEYRAQISPGHLKEFYTWVPYLLDPKNRVKVLIKPR